MRLVTTGARRMKRASSSRRGRLVSLLTMDDRRLTTGDAMSLVGGISSFALADSTSCLHYFAGAGGVRIPGGLCKGSVAHTLTEGWVVPEHAQTFGQAVYVSP